MKRLAAAFLTSTMLVACGLVPPKPKVMYDGPVRGASELATVSEGSRGWLHVVSIDGKHVVNPVAGGAPFTTGLLVLPGRHKLLVRYANVDSFALVPTGTVVMARAEADVELDARAGHSYALQGRRGQQRYEFWFVDLGTGYDANCLGPQPYAARFLRNETVPGC